MAPSLSAAVAAAAAKTPAPAPPAASAAAAAVAAAAAAAAAAAGPTNLDVSDDDVYEALSTVLEHEPSFQLVVDRVFADMDFNRNGSLEAHEMGVFLAKICQRYGIEQPPNTVQVAHAFRHLDLNCDNAVERDEMEAFLRHLFQERLATLVRARQRAAPNSAPKAAPKPGGLIAAAAAMGRGKPEQKENAFLARIKASKGKV